MRNNLLIIITSLLALSTSCSIHGTYKNRTNTNYSADWIVLNKGGSFEYTDFNHLHGYGYTQGSWNLINDTVTLTEQQPRLPEGNKIIEVDDGRKLIEVFFKEGDTLAFAGLHINGKIDSIATDFDGMYDYSEHFKRVDSIKIYWEPYGPFLNAIGNFKTKCSNCSYKIFIDWENVTLKSNRSLPQKWIYSNNRLYPINFSEEGEKLYYKKTKPLNEDTGFFRRSWELRKKGYE